MAVGGGRGWGREGGKKTQKSVNARVEVGPRAVVGVATAIRVLPSIYR